MKTGRYLLSLTAIYPLAKNNVPLEVKLVPSNQCLADPLGQGGFCRGQKTVFQPFITLQTDLFASPGDKISADFAARWPHWEAKATDPQDHLGGRYANPHLSIIQKFLGRLRFSQRYPRLHHHGGPYLKKN